MGHGWLLKSPDIFYFKMCFQVEENPLLTGLSDTINGAEDLVKRLWSGDEKSWQSARQKV